ncbi:hypothetical protein [Cellulomonas xiejunii]|uniref:Uncharacterized protein n=1 Tax=Cellulomonas xiejunii TaxID=2968083 RepID=A0ABY5KNP7_9CELL|nr:hypothetical protein [Cellulomonas xiejunii]MCC2321552.1 hypothetical protein [Cellulomonas xiejunii]MCC2323296.1 hypothetical protein [Cellulomonas xiejunii]UUI72122.1 hypothetical protein NP048_01230 [Cellulomonas xiejunii]
MEPTVTDWIGAATGVLTFVAAAVAGYFAGRAAHWTKKQAEASTRQVQLTEGQLDVARQEADRARALGEEQRRDVTLAVRRAAEQRVDATMPTVLIRATPGAAKEAFIQELLPLDAGRRRWGDLDEAQDVSDFQREGQVFRVHVTIHLENPSDYIARVALVDGAGGELHGLDADGVVVRPRAETTLTWTKTLPAHELGTPRAVHLLTGNVRLRWRVRDIALNAYDEVDLVLNLNNFLRDSFSLRVHPHPTWQESVGVLVPGRVYDRLDG